MDPRELCQKVGRMCRKAIRDSGIETTPGTITRTRDDDTYIYRLESTDKKSVLEPLKRLLGKPKRINVNRSHNWYVEGAMVVAGASHHLTGVEVFVYYTNDRTVKPQK